MSTVIVKDEIEVPLGILIEVADLLIKNEITHEITDTDAENGSITLEIEYEKEQRDTIHEIEDLIEDFEEDDDDEEDEEEEEVR